MRPLNVATFRQNVGFLSVPPALWRGAATSHFRPREVYHSLGIDIDTATVRDPSGRPRYLIDSHRPIPELIG